MKVTCVISIGIHMNDIKYWDFNAPCESAAALHLSGSNYVLVYLALVLQNDM